MYLPRSPHQVDPVSDLGHEGFREAKSPISILEFGNRANGVAARIGSVVVGAVVVDGPVRKLKMGVRAHRILVEEIGHAELAEPDFQATAGDFIEQRKKVALVFHLIFAERKHFVNQAASQVGSLAEQRSHGVL